MSDASESWPAVERRSGQDRRRSPRRGDEVPVIMDRRKRDDRRSGEDRRSG